jgi:hypothetical protein
MNLHALPFFQLGFSSVLRYSKRVGTVLAWFEAMARRERAHCDAAF